MHKRGFSSDGDKELGVTRRGFLKGVATTAAAGSAVAFGGLAGNAIASEMATGSGEAVSGSSIASGQMADTTLDAAALARQAAANLNPQDYDYRSNTTDLSTLFSEWHLGPLTLSHRMVKSAAGSSPSPELNAVTEYYRGFAKGGIEMIWVEDFVDMYEHFPIGWHQPKEVGEPTLKSIVDAVHGEGAYLGYQLSTMGASFSGFDAATAAEYECAIATDLTYEEVQQLQADYIAAAVYVQGLGFDGVEINAAGNNLGQSFFSRERNSRDDEYGPQSFENRARFVSGIIEGIKAACGEDFIVQVLINAIEENDKSLGDNSLMTTVEENREIAKVLEAAGADSLHVRLGPWGMHVCQFASDLFFTGYGIEGTTGFGTQYDFTRHWEGKLIANHSGCGMLLDVAAEIKSAVSIPVGTVTYMDPAHAPDFFENALKDGKVDFLLMNRPLTVDMEYVNKLREGRIDEIAPCTRCMHCHSDYTQDGQQVFNCRVNACLTRVFTDAMPEGYDPTPASSEKNVMVIGGGPAGMEAARIAAQRGYAVTLYEKKNAVGGLLAFASAVKGPHENLDDLRTYLEHQLDLKGVKVVKNQEVDTDFINEQKPDVVILATGGRRDALGLEGTDGTKVISIDDFATAEIGQNVTIAGANEQAIDVALVLIAQGKNVTFVFPDAIDGFDKGQSNWVKTFVKPMIFARGARAYPQGEIKSIGDGEITISGETGVDMAVKCDTVIEAMDVLDNTDILQGVSADIETHAIGDCNAPWSECYANIENAIAAGNLLARSI